MNSETFRDLRIKKIYLETEEQKVFFCKHKRTDETYLVHAIINQKPFELVNFDRMNEVLGCYDSIYEEEQVRYLIIKSEESFGIESYLDKNELSDEQRINYTEFLLEKLDQLRFLPIQILCSLFSYENVIIDLNDEMSFLGLIILDKSYMKLDSTVLFNNFADMLTDFFKDPKTRKLPKEIKAIVKNCRERRYINYNGLKNDFAAYAEVIKREIYLRQKQEEKERKKIIKERKNIRSVFNNSEKSMKETAKEEEIVVEKIEIEQEIPQEIAEENIAVEENVEVKETFEDTGKVEQLDDIYSKLQQNAYMDAKFEKQDTIPLANLDTFDSGDDEIKEALVDEFFNAIRELPEDDKIDNHKSKEVVKVKESLLNMKTIATFLGVTIAMVVVLYLVYSMVLKKDANIDTAKTQVTPTVVSENSVVEKQQEASAETTANDDVAAESENTESQLETEAINNGNLELIQTIKEDELSAFYGGELLKKANPQNSPLADSEEVYKGTHSFKLVNETNEKKEFYVGGVEGKKDNKGASVKLWLKSDKKQTAVLAALVNSENGKTPYKVSRPIYLSEAGWMQYVIEIEQNNFETAQIYVSTVEKSSVWIDDYEVNYK
ncbi:MAG: hypothetical protein N4A40_06890 [Tissierellales bacterium]|jgi:hypothetical protein|nr:hypothetical protein [Tissierellales bacterium]